MKNRKSLSNSLAAVVASMASILISFVAQRIFLHILNTEYLGLNGLFSNIISMLGIFELGIGSAITFSLYKPLAQDDKPTIKALMNFYKKAYRIIALVVFAVGVSITPFLNFFIKEVTIDVNIHIIYLMFVADVVLSYFLTYRRSILYADQKNYQISLVHIGYLILMNAFQLTILALTKNYYLYLSVKIMMRMMENLVIHFLVRQQYPYLDSLDNARLDKTVERDIFKKIKALIFHKIGTFIVLGSDNLIISKFIGLVEVGLYSNYYLIINATNQLVGQAITALTPTVGRKLATEKSENTYTAFRKTRFVGFVMACIISTGFLVASQPFVSLWIGEEYVLAPLVVAMLSFNMFQKLQRYAYGTFKEAAGIYHEDRFVPLVESLLNIIASIILLQFFGLAGVFMGTIISGLALWCYSYPKFVYRGLFKRSYLDYAKETLGYILVFLVCASISYSLTDSVAIDNQILQLCFNAVSSIVISVTTILIIFRNNDNLKYLRNSALHYRKKQDDATRLPKI